jgi:hypothetical protein
VLTFNFARAGTLGYGWNLRHHDFWPNYMDLQQVLLFPAALMVFCLVLLTK